MDNFLLLSILFTIFIRWLVSRFSYSGENKPPMYGDYEAQRHWMEITTNLDIKEWYINSTSNDLLYWGLDYPPLTAYHSYFNGLISHSINSNWTELFNSRGFESYYHKLFMRSSVLIPDILIFFTGTVFYWIQSRNQLTKREKSCIIFFNLFYPGLILIDHGHFQYNSISLGLTIWAVFFLMHSRVFIGSILFCLALNYKQMSLYHAPPFFFYLLGYAFTKKTYFKTFKTLLGLGFVVIITFTFIWFPFYDQVPHLLNRIFPVYRGLFEDKVANFWCIMDFVFKLKANYSQEKLAFYSLILTSICLLPSSIDLLRDPRFGKFRYALVNSSLVFFLFSYHVHEKQILLPALAVSLTLERNFYAGILFYIVSTFSILPLLIKDDLQLPYFVITCLFLGFSYVFIQRDIGLMGCSDFTKKSLYIFYKIVVLGCALISNLQFFYKPPERYPDLFTLLNAGYSWSLFTIFVIYYHYRQFTYKDTFIQVCPSKSKLNID